MEAPYTWTTSGPKEPHELPGPPQKISPVPQLEPDWSQTEGYRW
jgi:hypothetical protein